MKALILASGRGSRLQEHSTHTPKAMTLFKNKPLLHWQIEAFLQAGIQDIAVTTGYLANKIQHHAIKAHYHNHHWATTNMVQSMLCAYDWLKDEGAIISYSDIIYKPQAVINMQQQQHDVAVLYDVNAVALWQQRFDNILDDMENFTITNSNIITHIGGKAQNVAHIQGQFMGLIYFAPTTIQFIKKTFTSDALNKLDMTSLLSCLQQHHFTLHGVPYNLQWGEIDTMADLALYEQILTDF